MIDPTLRLEAISNLAARREPAVLLMDVVLGYGADPDPAYSLVPALTAARRSGTLPVVIALIGTDGDPQGWSRQADALAAAGAAVFASNAAATRYALDLLGASE
jgi:FdrA protein